MWNVNNSSAPRSPHGGDVLIVEYAVSTQFIKARRINLALCARGAPFPLENSFVWSLGLTPKFPSNFKSCGGTLQICQ